MSIEMSEPVGHLKLRMLGVPVVEAGAIRVPIQRVGCTLLASLAFARGALSRRTLAMMLWPDADTTTGLARLRRLLYRLEQALPAGALSATPEAVALSTQAWSTDVDEAFAIVHRMPAPHDMPAFDAARRCAGELALPLLDGIASPSETFEDARRALQLDMERMRLRLLAHLADALADANRVDEAIEWAARLVEADDLRETSHVLLMRLHAQAGDLASVEAAYARCAARLREEFGVRPSTATERAWQAISDGLSQSHIRRHAPPDVRYAFDAKGAIAYREVGEGEDVLVLAPGFVSHIEIGMEWSGVARFIGELAKGRRVLVFDRRGMGLSERLTGGSTVDLLAADLRTVLDAANVRDAWIFGASEGALGAVRFAASNPTRVRGLVLFGALAKGSASKDFPHALPALAFDAWLERILADWGGPAGIETFAPSAVDDMPLRAWWARLLRHAITPAGIAAVLRGFRDADVRVDAAALRCPALVLHRVDDRAVRFEGGRDLAARIRGACFVALDGDDHWWWRGDQDAVLSAVERFMASGDGQGTGA